MAGGYSCCFLSKNVFKNFGEIGGVTPLVFFEVGPANGNVPPPVWRTTPTPVPWQTGSDGGTHDGRKKTCWPNRWFFI